MWLLWLLFSFVQNLRKSWQETCCKTKEGKESDYRKTHLLLDIFSCFGKYTGLSFNQTLSWALGLVLLQTWSHFILTTMLGRVHDYPHFNCNKIGSERLVEPELECGCCLPLATVLHTTHLSISISYTAMIFLNSIIKYPMDNWGKDTEGGAVKVWRAIKSYWGGDGRRAGKLGLNGTGWRGDHQTYSKMMVQGDMNSPILMFSVRPQKHISYFLICLHFKTWWGSA